MIACAKYDTSGLIGMSGQCINTVNTITIHWSSSMPCPYPFAGPPSSSSSTGSCWLRLSAATSPVAGSFPDCHSPPAPASSNSDSSHGTPLLSRISCPPESFAACAPAAGVGSDGALHVGLPLSSLVCGCASSYDFGRAVAVFPGFLPCVPVGAGCLAGTF